MTKFQGRQSNTQYITCVQSWFPWFEDISIKQSMNYLLDSVLCLPFQLTGFNAWKQNSIQQSNKKSFEHKSPFTINRFSQKTLRTTWTTKGHSSFPHNLWDKPNTIHRNWALNKNYTDNQVEQCKSYKKQLKHKCLAPVWNKHDWWMQKGSIRFFIQ